MRWIEYCWSDGWNTALNCIGSVTVMQRQKRHYSLPEKSEVASYQRNY
jgi:hypothetical protein